MTNRSKGFGFVEMSSDAEAEKAIAMFHDQEFQGRRLTVNVARPLAPREDRPRRAFYFRLENTHKKTLPFEGVFSYVYFLNLHR